MSQGDRNVLGDTQVGRTESQSTSGSTPAGRLRPCPRCCSENIAEYWIGWIPPDDPAFDSRVASGEVIWNLGCEWDGMDRLCHECGLRYPSSTRHRWDAWIARLHSLEGVVISLPCDLEGRLHDERAPYVMEPVVIPAGSEVRYVTTRYDPYQIERARHLVRVVSGPVLGASVWLDDTLETDPFPWESQT